MRAGRCNGLLLGYLWLIDDAEQALGPAEIALTEDATERAGVVLYRRLVLRERSKARHEAIQRALVSSDPASRAQAVEDLRAEHLFPDGPVHVRVLAVQLNDDDPAAAVALETAIEDGLRASDAPVSRRRTGPGRGFCSAQVRRATTAP